MGVSLTALGERSTVNHSDHFINYENWHMALLEAGQRGQVAAEPLGEAQVFGGVSRVGKGSRGDQEPSPFETNAILYENALADVIR
jgi:hypothetical protein